MNQAATSTAARAALPARSFPSCAGRQRGFSLIEILVTLAVLGVLAGIGMSSWKHIGATMKLNSHASGFLAHFHFARSEAIKRNGRVVICKSARGADCEQAGSWDQGWIVFHDTNANGIRDDDEGVIKRGNPLPRGWKIVGNQTVSRYLTFDHVGSTILTSGAFQAGTVSLCREGQTDARQLVINAVGRPRIEKTRLGQCA